MHNAQRNLVFLAEILSYFCMVTVKPFFYSSLENAFGCKYRIYKMAVKKDLSTNMQISYLVVRQKELTFILMFVV